MYAFQEIGRAEQEFTVDPTKQEISKELDRDAFLQLLTAQLGNQDPLNPMEDKEFTAQLADFSSLEQLTNINEGIGDMNEASKRQEMLSAVSFIGKQIRAEGDTVSKYGDYSSTVYYGLEEPVTNVNVNIFDSWGNVIRTIQGGAMQGGMYEFQWDGKDWQGSDAPDGTYTVSISAEGADGQPVMVDTEVNGTVAGVSTYEGQHYLRLRDGRTVKFMDVQEVVNPAAPPADGGEEETGGGDESQESEETTQ
jgi:flagellar basal-body rod modification protein FlgD